MVQYQIKLNISGIELDQVHHIYKGNFTIDHNNAKLIILQIMESITTTAFPDSSASIFEVKLFSKSVSRLVGKIPKG